MATNNNNNTYLNDSSLIPKYIMEEILDIYGDSKAELLPEYSKEYKLIEEIVNKQIEEEERKRLMKEKFSILQKSLKKLMIQKLSVNFKTIYLVEGTAIFYYDDIFNNHLMKDKKDIPVIGHSGRLAFTHKLNDEEVLIVHKSAMKNLLEMNISDQSRIFDLINDETYFVLNEDFIESPLVEKYIILHGLDIKCIENIIKFIDNKIDLESMYNNSPVYYYLLMVTPFYISALAYFDKEYCVINEFTVKDDINNLIYAILLRAELKDYIDDERAGFLNSSNPTDHLLYLLMKICGRININDYKLFNSTEFIKKHPVEKILYLAKKNLDILKKKKDFK